MSLVAVSLLSPHSELAFKDKLVGLIILFCFCLFFFFLILGSNSGNNTSEKLHFSSLNIVSILLLNCLYT